MKKISATLFVLVVILALAGTASAQSTLKANIPFDFTVGDKHLEKGEYIVRLDSSVVQLSHVERLRRNVVGARGNSGTAETRCPRVPALR